MQHVFISRKPVCEVFHLFNYALGWFIKDERKHRRRQGSMERVSDRESREVGQDFP